MDGRQQYFRQLVEDREKQLKKQGVPRKQRREMARQMAREKLREVSQTIVHEQALIPCGATGSTADFGSVDVGSNPAREAKIQIIME